MPTLTGLTTQVTFDENVLNGGPQLIDADVAFTDPDGNFAGGSLTVSGLVLGEDRVSVRNEGQGPGQIGVVDGNITYGGVVIGPLNGGIGDTFTVSFNAAATSAAIDALIQNLTFANISDAPISVRELVLNVTDANGAGLFDAETSQPGLTIYVNINNQDDPAVAVADIFTTSEMTVLHGNLFADNNGSGPDRDADSDLEITAINGLAFTFDQPITLPSGALLTVSANGDFAFDTNGQFEYLPSSQSGASPTQVSTSFNYTLQGGLYSDGQRQRDW